MEQASRDEPGVVNAPNLKASETASTQTAGLRAHENTGNEAPR
jgi:hypothetical protein